MIDFVWSSRHVVDTLSSCSVSVVVDLDRVGKFCLFWVKVQNKTKVLGKEPPEQRLNKAHSEQNKDKYTTKMHLGNNRQRKHQTQYRSLFTDRTIQEQLYTAKERTNNRRNKDWTVALTVHHHRNYQATTTTTSRLCLAPSKQARAAAPPTSGILVFWRKAADGRAAAICWWTLHAAAERPGQVFLYSKQDAPAAQKDPIDGGKI